MATGETVIQRSEMATPIYAIVGEFDDADTLIEAARRVRSEGYRKVEAYSPFPVHGLAEALEVTDSTVFVITFLAGVAGFIGGCFLEAWTSSIDYPMNVGGRPYVSWPSFVPVAYECTILAAAFGALLGMLGLNGLPRPYHSIFNTPNFDRASQDKFFLAIEAADRRFDPNRTADFMKSVGATAVSEVEA